MSLATEILTQINQNEYLRATVILVLTIILAKAVHLFLKNYVKKIAEKTKTNLDDVIIGFCTKPFFILIPFIGVYFALKSLTILVPYYKWINGASFIILILLSSVILVKIINTLILHWLHVKKKFEKAPKLVSKIIDVVIYLIVFLIILDHFNIAISPLLATLGVGALAIGLALQNTLANLFAGIHIISDRPIRVGDFIEIGDLSGYVEDIGWRSTKIRRLPNVLVIVPNAKLAESTIINNSLPVQEMSVVIQCGVDYTSNLDKVEKITTDVAKKIQKSIPGAIKDFEPFVRFHTFADSNINFSIIMRVEKYVDKYLLTHELIKALKKRYDKEKIEISWPIMKVYQMK